MRRALMLTEYVPLITHDVATTMGATVTPGNNTMGAWATVWATPLVGDYHLIEIFVNGIGANAKASNALLDFGWDPAGGTNYGATPETIIPYLNVGYAGISNLGGISFVIPVKIPNGATLGARCQINNATVGTAQVWAIVSQARDPRLAKFGTQVLSFGEQTSVSRGVDITFPTGVGDGSYTLIGVVPDPAPFLWIAEACHNNISALSSNYGFNHEIAFGPNSTDVKPIGERWNECIIGSGEARGGRLRCVAMQPVPGQNIYAKGRAGSATAYTIMVHGVR